MNQKLQILLGLTGNCSYTVYVIGYDKYNNVKYSEQKTISTLSIIDFVSKLTESTFTSSGNNYYNFLQSGGGFFNGYSGITSYPVVIASNTSSYAYLYSKNPIGYNLKTIDIEVRTRNDGTNWGPASIGIVNNPGSNPTWITGLYTNWNAATTPSWVTYKTTINIPNGVNTANNYFEIYLGHVGSAYTMWMDFQNLKGYF